MGRREARHYLAQAIRRFVEDQVGYLQLRLGARAGPRPAYIELTEGLDKVS